MALILQQVSYAYPGAGRNAVDNCSFEFLPGRFYGIFGSNGSRYIRISLCAKNDMLEEALRRIKSMDN